MLTLFYAARSSRKQSPQTTAKSSRAENQVKTMSERQEENASSRSNSQYQSQSLGSVTPLDSPAAPLTEEQEAPSSSGSGSTDALATARQGTDDTDQGAIERDRESPAGDR